MPRLELAVDPVQRTLSRYFWNGRANSLAAPHAAQILLLHKPLDGATCHRNTFPVQLLPDLSAP